MFDARADKALTQQQCVKYYPNEPGAGTTCDWLDSEPELADMLERIRCTPLDQIGLEHSSQSNTWYKQRVVEDTVMRGKAVRCPISAMDPTELEAQMDPVFDTSPLKGEFVAAIWPDCPSWTLAWARRTRRSKQEHVSI